MVFILYSFCSFAEPGFFAIDDSSIPTAVRQAAQSVFKVVTPDSENHQPTAVIDMATELSQYEHKWDADSWEQSQLEFCKNNQVRFCPVFPKMSNGSGFLAQDDHTVYSVLHNFNDFLAVQVQKQSLFTSQEIRTGLKSQALPLVMVSANQDIVFASKTNVATMAHFNANFDLFNLDLGNNTFSFRLSDRVRLKVATPLRAQPLKIASQLPKPGDRVYGVGFPAQTTNRKLKFGAKDSDGENLWISKGHVISTEEWMKRNDVDLPDAVKKAYDDYMVLVDFDVEHGDSGGPILNEKGEVVGVIETIDDDITTTPNGKMSGGLKIFDEAKLQKLWDLF